MSIHTIHLHCWCEQFWVKRHTLPIKNISNHAMCIFSDVLFSYFFERIAWTTCDRLKANFTAFIYLYIAIALVRLQSSAYLSCIEQFENNFSFVICVVIDIVRRHEQKAFFKYYPSISFKKKNQYLQTRSSLINEQLWILKTANQSFTIIEQLIQVSELNTAPQLTLYCLGLNICQKWQ